MTESCSLFSRKFTCLESILSTCIINILFYSDILVVMVCEIIILGLDCVFLFFVDTDEFVNSVHVYVV